MSCSSVRACYGIEGRIRGRCGPVAMRVDHAIVNVAEPANGVAEFVRGLAVAEAGAGVEVHVHAIRPPAHLAGVAAHFYPANACWPASAGMSSALRRGVEEAARAAGVLHVHNLWSGMAMSMPLAACGESGRTVWSLHGALHPGSLAVSRLRKRLAWMIAQRAVIGRSDLLHATSIEELAYCREAGLRMPVVVVPAGVEIPATFGPRGVGHQQRRGGFAGRGRLGITHAIWWYCPVMPKTLGWWWPNRLHTACR